MQVGLADEYGAGLTETPYLVSIVFRYKTGHCNGACGRRHVLCVVIVLEQDRDAVQWTSYIAGGTFAVERRSFLDRTRIDVDHRVELRTAVVECFDARQVLPDKLLRGGFTTRHRGLYFRNRSLEGVKCHGLRSRVCSAGDSHQEGGKVKGGKAPLYSLWHQSKRIRRSRYQ